MTDETPWPQMDKGRPVRDDWKQPPGGVFGRIKDAIIGRPSSPDTPPAPPDADPSAWAPVPTAPVPGVAAPVPDAAAGVTTSPDAAGTTGGGAATGGAAAGAATVGAPAHAATAPAQSPPVAGAAPQGVPLQSDPAAGAPQLDPAQLDPAHVDAAQAVPAPGAAAAEATASAGTASAGTASEGTETPEPVAPRPPCRQCGGEVDGDGYCTQCGTKAPTEREHFEEAPAAWVGAVCDRGVRHARNEDALATAADAGWGSRAILVVCDGVTTSDDSDVAALAAARAARDVLHEAGPIAMGTPASRNAALSARLAKAAAVANDAVAEKTLADATNPAACTFVAALIDDGQVHVGNVGDSRAYWLPDVGVGRILSRDDSMAEDSIAAGVPRKQAEEASDAHTITRWLGVDSADVMPHVAAMAVRDPGWVLVCSDGLWNYASEPEELGRVLAGVARVDGVTAPVDVARALVDWAIDQGGHDNISVCLARVGVPEPPPASAPVSDATVKLTRTAPIQRDPSAASTADAVAAAHPDAPSAAGLLQAHEAANAGIGDEGRRPGGASAVRPDSPPVANTSTTPLEG